MKKTIIPNFLIVGAAKAGTTSIYNALKKHPQVFLPQNKEPHFFSQHKTPALISTWESYLNLFEGAKEQIAIGEASVSYLFYHQKAIPEIKKKIGDVKIIIILRNPVDRAYSDFKMDFRKGTVKGNFEKFIENPNNIYIEMGYYHDQVKAYLKEFSNVKILFYENISNDSFMDEIYDFLEIKHLQIKLNKDNFGGVWRNSLVSKINFIYQNNKLIYKWTPEWIKLIVKKLFFVRDLRKLTKKQIKQLQIHFRSDISKLSNLIGENLSNWLI